MSIISNWIENVDLLPKTPVHKTRLYLWHCNKRDFSNTTLIGSFSLFKSLRWLILNFKINSSPKKDLHALTAFHLPIFVWDHLPQIKSWCSMIWSISSFVQANFCLTSMSFHVLYCPSPNLPAFLSLTWASTQAARLSSDTGSSVKPVPIPPAKVKGSLLCTLNMLLLKYCHIDLQWFLSFCIPFEY